MPLRRVFRFLWALAAVAILAGLPTLILDFRHSGYSVHYQVRTRDPYAFVCTRCCSEIWELLSTSPAAGWGFASVDADRCDKRCANPKIRCGLERPGAPCNAATALCEPLLAVREGQALHESPYQPPVCCS